MHAVRKGQWHSKRTNCGQIGGELWNNITFSLEKTFHVLRFIHVFRIQFSEGEHQRCGRKTEKKNERKKSNAQTWAIKDINFEN